MNSAVTLVNRGQRPAYFDQLAATVEEIDRWLLRQVITLADDAPGLTDELRDRLAALGPDRAHSGLQDLGISVLLAHQPAACWIEGYYRTLSRFRSKRRRGTRWP
jgi:hypothetical protein